MLQMLGQRDFGLFLGLLFCCLCVLECIVLNREEGPGRRWLSFFGFFLFQAAALSWTLVAPLLDAASRLPDLPTFLRSVAYGSLFAFAPVPGASRGGRNATGYRGGRNATGYRGRKGIVPAIGLGLVAAGAVFGLAGGGAAYSLLVHAFLGVPGTVFAVLFILSDPARRNTSRPWLTAYAVVLGVSVACLAAESAAGVLSPALFRHLFLPLHVFLSLALVITLTVHEWRSFTRANRDLGGRLTRGSIYGAFFAIPVLILLGGILSSVLGTRTLSRVRQEHAANVELLRSTLWLQTDEMDDNVSILARTQAIVDLFSGPDAPPPSAADAMLDMYAKATPGSTFYILDTDGRARASSNRGSPLSFVGRVLPEIPDSVSLRSEYTQVEGQWRFFASPGQTGTRGYYAASAVHDARGRRVGTAVGKLNVESVLVLSGSSGDVLLVNALGVVLLSSSQRFSFRTLWPLTPSLRRQLTVSHQFEKADFHPMITREPVDGSIVAWQGTPSLVTRAFLQLPGWSLVAFGSIREMVLSRMAGMLLTFIAVLVIAGYAVAAQLALLDEARVERSERLYRTLIEGTPNWISIVNEGGAFLFTNQAGQDSVGLAKASWSRTQVERVLGTRAAGEIAAMVRESAGGGIVSSETAIPGALGGERTWRLTLVPLEHEGPASTAILIGNDVTEIRQAEARLVRAERMEAVGTLAAGVAHQFNNINAVALGYLQVLQLEQGMPASAARYAGLVRIALERSVDLTSRLLPLSIPLGAQQSLVDLVDVVRGAIPDVQPDLDREKVHLELENCEPAAAIANREQMGFVVRGLLVNAWHAVLGKAIRAIRLSSGTGSSMVFLRVQDTGSGILPEKMSSLFTPFYSEKGEHAAPRSPQSGVRGVGLSLSVSHAIISGLGGRIDVESTPGEGSTFTVWLPAAPADTPG